MSTGTEGSSTGRWKGVGLLAAVFVTAAFLLGACGGGGGGAGSSGEPVNFGTVDWPEAIAKTNVSAEMVQALGYETEVQTLSVPLVFQGLETGDLDLFVEAWFPTMQTNMEAVNPDEVKSVTTNLPEATFSVAVNKAACDAGVTSHEDLDRFKDEFGGRIYGIEPGNDGNQVVLDMIKNDTYGLGDWEIVESSTSGMLSEVDKAVREGEWVAFTGWEPHWMGQKYDMCLLEDPEGAWGGASHVETLANAGLEESHPEVWQLFEQMKVNKDIQGYWIDQIDNSDKEPEEIAVDWLRDNPEVTDKWLEGVEAADGTPGAEALKAHLE
jgi:glycine betaine/proline transport system substrate-binding protein